MRNMDHRAQYRRQWRKVRTTMQYYLALIPFSVLRALPYHAAVELGGRLGKWVSLIDTPDRRRALQQFSDAFGGNYSQPEVYQQIQQMYIHFGKSLAEVLHLNSLSIDEFFSLVRMDGEEHLHNTFTQGKGAIIVTGHIGNWEYMAAYIAARGYPLTVLARANPVPGFDRLISETRQQAGYRPLDRSTFTAAKESLRALRRGEILGILIDQDTKVDGCFVDFFHKPAWTPVGAATLHLRTGAPLVLMSSNRDVNNRHVITVHEPYTFRKSGNKTADCERITQILTRELEKRISQNPSQWVWVHRRWKTKPR